MFRVRFHVFKCQVRVERSNPQTFEHMTGLRSTVHGPGRVGDCFGSASHWHALSLDDAFDKYYYRNHREEKNK
ncbi:MAG: hypothetical protein Kow0070_29960 [Anaerolineales bacterium]